jgi:TonB family protein
MRIRSNCRLLALRTSVIYLLAAALIGIHALAQSAAQPPADSQAAAFTLSDGQTRLLRATRVNGLMGAGKTPWHLRFTFKIFNWDDNIKESGTYEEWWVSPTRYKRLYTSQTASYKEFGTENGILRTAGTSPRPIQVTYLYNDFYEPLPSDAMIPKLEVVVQKSGDGNTAIECLSTSELHPGMQSRIPSSRNGDCIDAQSYELRSIIFESGIHEDRFSTSVDFHGSFVARDVQIIQAGKINASAHLETVEDIANIQDIDFTPAPDAVLVSTNFSDAFPLAGIGGITNLNLVKAGEDRTEPMKIRLSAGVAQGILIKAVPPQYPPDAKAANVSGTVVIQATIGTDGALRELRAVSGDPMLIPAALQAVTQWQYRPYMLNGKPVEVLTTINVVFQLGPR